MTVPKLGAGVENDMPSNPGRLPRECVIYDERGNVTGHRAVHVRLFGGWDSRKAGHAPWPSGGGRTPTDWSISKPPHPFQIKEYEIT